MESTLRRTWAEIDLDALAHNYRTLRAHVGPAVKFLGVVKADGYGHGAIQVSRTLEALGADYLAVSSIDEAMELRHNGIAMPILILGHTPREQVKNLIDLHITQAVTCAAKAEEYSAEAVKCGGTLKVHIKVDTGMSRLGYLCGGEMFDTGVEGICHACSAPGLEAEGIFTHFAVADEPDADSRAYTLAQFDLFRRVIDAVEQRLGRRFAIRHCANSGAVAAYPETYLDMVRPGILLYGCTGAAKALGLVPVMTLKTTISTIKTYAPGVDISYGRLFTTPRTTRMGVVPYGYADGFFRVLSDRCAMMTADGPAGLRIKPECGVTTTAFPCATLLACTWNTGIVREIGAAGAREVHENGVGVWLTPAINIHRTPLCGRNFEYFSEDPLVSGLTAAAITRGVQKHPGRGVTIKHFAANNQETNRYNNNSNVSQRALREISLRGFGLCIRESQPRAVMTSYNLINGTHTSESRALTTDILRGEFGFRGIVMTDWVVGGSLMYNSKRYPMPNAGKVALAGGDLFMPGSRADYNRCLAMLRQGTLPRYQLELNATRVVHMARKLTEEEQKTKE